MSTQDASPFHPGEQALQTRAGTRERTEALGRRVIRDYLPEQHRKFYAGLPYLYVGSVDERGTPWASMLTGQPGFIRSPTPHRLDIDTLPHASDPLAGNLAAGAAIGILGLDYSNRRRNRVNGRVCELSERGFAINVDQAFGNCPKYIRRREAENHHHAARPRPTVSGTALDAPLRNLVGQAETFFIATTNPESGRNGGADVSHRGGKPGFIRVTDHRTLTFPDYAGNGHFNTFGNLERCNRAGLLFVDFTRGDMLQLAGRADVVWEGAELAAFQGAQRLVHFHLERYVYTPAAVGLRFVEGETSPFLEDTGDWQAVAAGLESQAASARATV